MKTNAATPSSFQRDEIAREFIEFKFSFSFAGTRRGGRGAGTSAQRVNA
jgi:hypothetical protein